MPLAIIPGPEVVQNLRENPFGHWPKGRRAGGSDRLEPICKPEFLSRFKLDYDDRIFCIGSCFAREIEEALGSRGFEVVTRNLPKDDKAFVKMGTGFLNAYGAASILNELEWGLEERGFDAARHIIEVAPNRYVDLHSAWIAPEPRALVMARRQMVTSLYGQVRDCRIVVMTLGLSEVWYDNETRAYLNVSPMRSLMTKFPGRFVVHVMSYADTAQCLRSIFELMRRQCREDQKILLTVSPVPFAATARKMDALVANSYSKSVLRAAVEEVAGGYSNIDYFPSYESVTLSDRHLAWEDDLLHVRRALIETNVTRMIEAYRPDKVAKPATSDVTKRVNDAAEAFSLGDDHAAIHFLEPIRELTKSNADLGFFYAELCMRLNRLDDAKEVLKFLPDDGRRTRLDAMMQIRSGDADRGLESLVKMTHDGPQNTAAWQALVEGYQALGRRDEALASMRAWIDAQPHFVEPWRQLAQLHRDSGDFVQAEKAYVRALETVQNAQPTYLLLQFAKFLIDRGRFTDAAATLAHIHPSSLAELRHRNALQLLLPEDALAKVANSQVATSIGSDAKLDAEEEAVMAAEQDAKQLRSATNHWRSGRFEEAIAAASPLVERPVRVQARQVIARSLTRLSRWPEAEAQWRALFDGGLQDADTCAALASVLIEQGRLQEAVPYFRSAYTKAPRFAHSMAALLLATGAPQEASRIVEHELSSRPGDEPLLKLRQRIGKTSPDTRPSQ